MAQTAHYAMSVGSKVPDIPIIDVKTGEDTTLLAIIGNGRPRSAHLADLCLALALTHSPAPIVRCRQEDCD